MLSFLGIQRELLWLCVMGAAVAAFLITDNFVAAAILPFAHAAWPSLHSGWWLLHSDPRRSRGWLCFLFYLSDASWKAAAAAVVAITTFLLVANFTGDDPTEDEFLITLFTLLGGLLLNAIIGAIAIVSALRQRARIWVHPRVQTLSGGDFRRLHRLEGIGPSFNHAVFAVGTAVVLPAIGTVVGLLAWLADEAVPRGAQPIRTRLLMPMLFGAPCAMILVYAWLSGRIVARHPAECWPPATTGDPLD